MTIIYLQLIIKLKVYVPQSQASVVLSMTVYFQNHYRFLNGFLLSVAKRVLGSPVPVDVFQFNVLPLILVPI